MYYHKVTRKQAEACFKLFCRDWPNHPWSETANTRRYRQFRRKFKIHYGGFLGGEWKGMFVGIEPDGYTHS